MPENGLPFKPSEASSRVFRPVVLLCALLVASCGPVGAPKASAVQVAVPVVRPSVRTAVEVVGVTDGDTLTVLMDGQQQQLRIHGIDAPERGQPFGGAAKRALSDLVFRKKVDLLIGGKDRWGQLIARVQVAWLDVGTAMVREGMAGHFVRYAPDDSNLAAMEVEATAAKRGLWADPAPVAPWDWRKCK
jgi:endonuclease YncB( thermonuclease family)